MSKREIARRRYLARIAREENAAKDIRNSSIGTPHPNIRYENSIVRCEGLADGRWSSCGMNPQIERVMAREKAVREGNWAAVKEFSGDYFDIRIPAKSEKLQKNPEPNFQAKHRKFGGRY